MPVIPTRGIEGFVRELVQQCEVSMTWRQQRGAVFRNFFLNGTADGSPATYNKTWAFIDNLSSWLYSPSELRFRVSPNGRYVSPVDRAKANAAADDLNTEIENSEVDSEIAQAVLWSVVKGKAFTKSQWGEDALECYMIQPEQFGVLREDLRHLHLQEAFLHRTYITRSRFKELILNHPDKGELEKRAAKYLKSLDDAAMPGQNNNIPLGLGGQAFTSPGPYRAGATPTNGVQQNFAYWLSTPSPSMDTRVIADLVPLDELWVWDSKRSDWTTFQIVGDDVLVEGRTAHRNLFADSLDPENTIRRQMRNDENPIAARQPFNEFCSIPVDGWFWGRSEIENVAPLQYQINARLDGINKLLRIQEDPPIFAKGINQSAQFVKSRMTKPGGTLVDTGPNGTIQKMAPDIPPGLYDSLRETLGMFNDMGGFPAVLRGEGEGGVRSQGHAATLSSNAAPRHKDRAMLYERQIGALGEKNFRILQAKKPEAVIAWVSGGVQSPEIPQDPPNPALEAPAPGMKQFSFLLNHIPPEWRVRVDSHSSSPAFSADTRRLMFDLNARGAATNEELIDRVHPPGEEELIASSTVREIARENAIRANPELALQPPGKKKR